MTMHATSGNHHPATPAGHLPAQLTHTAAGEGPAYWFFDCLAVVRTPEADTSPAILEVTVAPGGGAPLHVHADLDDSFYLLDGQLAMRCGEHTFLARPGDYVVLPRGIPHTFRVAGDQPARMLQVHQDDSFLRFIQAVGIPAATRTVPATTQLSIPLEDMPRIAAETGQPIIGPPMTEQEAHQIAHAEASSSGLIPGGDHGGA